MGNLTIFHTCVHDKRVIHHNLNYWKNVLHVLNIVYSANSITIIGIQIYL